MTVSELINELRKFDGNREVVGVRILRRGDKIPDDLYSVHDGDDFGTEFLDKVVIS